MLKRMVLWGATGQAKVLREFVGELGYEVVAVFDNDPSVAPCFVDVPLYYGKEGFKRWKTNNNLDQVACLVAIGGARGRDRIAMQVFLEGNGLSPAVVVHPFAYVARGASTGKGTQILARAVVGVDAKLGDACIINTGASVDHECAPGCGCASRPWSGTHRTRSGRRWKALLGLMPWCYREFRSAVMSSSARAPW